MKRILLTGYQGFIGRYLYDALSSHYEIEGLSRASGYDITDFETLQALETDAEVLIHTAAVASNDFEHAFDVNVTGTFNICKFAKERGIKHIILLSSIFALDRPDNGYFNSYGKTKKMAEEVAESYCKEHGITLTTVRLAQVYDDARAAQQGQAMLYYFIDTIREKAEITLFGKRNPLRNYIHIDYVTGCIKAMLEDTAAGTWNIVEEQNHTITEIAYMIFECYKIAPKITRLQEKPDIPSVHIPETLRYACDHLSSIPLKEGIQRIIDHDRQ